MKIITLCDTSVSSQNLGDYLIMDAIQDVIAQLFSEYMILRVPTHDVIRKPSYDCIRRSEHVFVCGTNLLTSHMLLYRQWKIGLLDSIFVHNFVLLGVGWWQYQSRPDFYTRVLLRRLLSTRKIHAVRDSYTEQQLRSIGFKNVVNTGCPTMWSLTREFCAGLPREKANAVVFTLTDYKPSPRDDAEMVKCLLNEYNSVYFWPQGTGDWEYFKSLGLGNKKKIEVVAPTIRSYKQLLETSPDLEYVGTRLHAGIRALTLGRRALIIGVDNRAIEIGADTGIPVLSRTEISSLRAKINTDYELQKIRIQEQNIATWKEQFEGRETR